MAATVDGGCFMWKLIQVSAGVKSVAVNPKS